MRTILLITFTGGTLFLTTTGMGQTVEPVRTFPPAAASILNKDGCRGRVTLDILCREESRMRDYDRFLFRVLYTNTGDREYTVYDPWLLNERFHLPSGVVLLFDRDGSAGRRLFVTIGDFGGIFLYPEDAWFPPGKRSWVVMPPGAMCGRVIETGIRHDAPSGETRLQVVVLDRYLSRSPFENVAPRKAELGVDLEFRKRACKPFVRKFSGKELFRSKAVTIPKTRSLCQQTERASQPVEPRDTEPVSRSPELQWEVPSRVRTSQGTYAVRLAARKPVLKQEAPLELMLHVETVLRGGDAYNPFFNRSVAPPARLAVFDAEENFVGDLIRYPDSSKFEPAAPTDWVKLTRGLCVGATLKFDTGQRQGRLQRLKNDKSLRVPCCKLPPGKYFIQAVYTFRFNAPQRRDGKPGRKQYWYDNHELMRSNVCELEIL